MYPAETCTPELINASRTTGDLRILRYDYPADRRFPKYDFASSYLILVSRGNYLQTGSGPSYECKQGMLLIQPAGYARATRFGTNGACCIAIQPGVALESDPAIRRLLGDHRRMCLPDAVRLQRRIERELLATDDASALALQAYVLELIAQACRNAESNTRREPAWLARVRERLHDVPKETPSLQELAKLAGVHPSYLAQRFHQVHGASIGEYLRRLRIEHARSALTATREPIAAIAADAGFADQSHFTRVFHRLTGETPLAWRRRTRNAS